MNYERQETLDDICQKIRDAGIPDLADHIEAAWKRQMSQSWYHREMEELVARHEREVAELKKRIGNAAALRQAVIKALTLLSVCDWPSGVSIDGVAEVVHEIESALDKPPRQCDVGTPEEQNRRFDNFCRGKDCKTCPCNVMPRCHMVWAQTPYEAELEGGAA